MGALTEQQVYRLADRMVEMSERADPNWDRAAVVIEGLWASLEQYVGYDILSTSQSEILNTPRGDRTVTLTYPNVTSVTFVSVSSRDVFKAKYTGSDTNARVEVTDSQVTLISRTAGTTTTSAHTFTDNPSTTNMAAAISLTVDWTGTLVEDYPSAYLIRKGARISRGVDLMLEAWEDYEGDYSIEYSEGLLTIDDFPVWGMLPQIRVDYVAGLASIPTDLELWLIQQALAKYDTAVVDGALESERLGDYSYKRANGTPLSQTAVFDESEVVQRYRRMLP